MLISIIIPAFNEEKGLASAITNYYNYLSAQPYDFEIIIVNDGSTDLTQNQAIALTNLSPKIKLIDQTKNLGKGASIRNGFLHAQGDYCLFIDADGATSINHLDLALPFINQGYDIIIGTRSKKDAPAARQIVRQIFWKRWLGTLGNLPVRLLLVKNIYDTQCGFKILSRQAIKKIIPQTKTNRWALDVEILTLAQKLNYRIAIIPVQWSNRPDSRVRIKGYFIMLAEIFLIKFNLLASKYNLNK